MLGLYHFAENPTSVLTARGQEQLSELVERISQFGPDAVAVEAPFQCQADINEAYFRFSLEDLDRMESNILGHLHLNGELYPILYVNEGVQIGFRLARVLGLDKVYAADYYFDMDMGSIYERAKKEIPSWSIEVNAYEERVSDTLSGVIEKNAIIETLRLLNSEVWYGPQHSLYYLWPAALGAGRDLAEYLLRWYERNIKTFANLANLCMVHERVFVLWGAGHLAVLRDLIQGCQGMKLMDVNEFLSQE